MIELVQEVGVDLINVSASDDMVAMAAWVSHDQDSEDRLKNVNQVKKLIHFLYKNKHMSPFEHGLFTFKIDAPLFVAREFFRHRTASYNEVSGRYTEMKPRFYVGTAARVQKGKPGDYYFEDASEEQTALYLRTKEKSAKYAWEVYQQRLEADIAKEQAREELPLSLMTQWYVTMNPRNLMQFLTLRNEKHALKEIQDVAVKMEAIFAENMPITYDAYVKVRDEQTEDVEELLNEIVRLKYQVSRLEAKNNSLLATVSEERNRAAKAEALRDEAVNKFNLAFTSQKESEKTAKQNKDWQYGNEYVHETESNNEKAFTDVTNVENVIADKVVPKVAGIVESAKPVYNIYMNLKDNGTAEDIAKKVVDKLKDIERRRR